MARKKKRKGDEEAPPPVPTGEATTSLRGLLKDVVLREPAKAEPRAKPAPVKKQKEKKDVVPPSGRPSDSLRGGDRTAYYDAYAGVKPLTGHAPRSHATSSPKMAPPPPAAARSLVDDEARARLAALVGGGVRFDVSRDGDELRGARTGTPAAVVRGLMRNDVWAEATLDLHGMRGEEAELEVVRFVRREQRKGTRRVCIVHGKGNHSPGGIGVLRDHVLHALTEGGGAPVVLAFATASHAQGGSGALMVELVR